MSLNFDPALPVNFITFSGGEEHVQIDIDTHLESSYVLYAGVYSSSEAMQLFLLLDALDKLARNRNHHINLTIKMLYMPYARQDRYCAEGQSFSLRVFINLLDSVIEGLSSLVVNVELEDVHSESTQVLINKTHHIRANYITQAAIFKRSPKLMEMLNGVDYIVTPDRGAHDKAKTIHSLISNNKLCEKTGKLIMNKTRDPKTGWITEMGIGDIVLRNDDKRRYVDMPFYIQDMDHNFYTRVLQDKVLMIPDDICDGGMTFLLIAKQLRKYNPKKIILYVTHGIFSKGLEEFEGLIDEIYTSNNINELQHDILATI